MNLKRKRREVSECLERLADSFDDLQERQINVHSLKARLRELSKAHSGVSNRLRVIWMCIDALENTKSENLTTIQLQSIINALGEMNKRLSHERTNDIEGKIFSTGLRPIPNLEGLAQYYTS